MGLSDEGKSRHVNASFTVAWPRSGWKQTACIDCWLCNVVVVLARLICIYHRVVVCRQNADIASCVSVAVSARTGQSKSPTTQPFTLE